MKMTEIQKMNARDVRAITKWAKPGVSCWTSTGEPVKVLVTRASRAVVVGPDGKPRLVAMIWLRRTAPVAP